MAILSFYNNVLQILNFELIILMIYVQVSRELWL